MGKANVILVVAAITIFSIISFTSYTQLEQAGDRAVDYHSMQELRNITNSFVGTLLSDIADDNNLKVVSPAKKDFMQHNFQYTIKDVVVGGENKKEINVWIVGDYAKKLPDNNGDPIVETIVSIPKSGYVPAAVKGAVTMKANYYSNGNLKVDGRDHKSMPPSGSENDASYLLSGKGTLGIFSLNKIEVSGSTAVTGTDNSGKDYALPGGGKSSESIVKQYGDTTGYPKTPEDVLGLKNGQTIKYDRKLTNPSGEVILSNNEVVHITLTGNKPGVQFSGKGLVVIHNAQGTAEVNKNNNKVFEGLVITDAVDKLHGDVLGAIVCLGDKSGNFGNGKGRLMFSSKAIQDAVGKATGLGGSFRFGFGKQRLQVDSYYEKF